MDDPVEGDPPELDDLLLDATLSGGHLQLTTYVGARPARRAELERFVSLAPPGARTTSRTGTCAVLVPAMAAPGYLGWVLSSGVELSRRAVAAIQAVADACEAALAASVDLDEGAVRWRPCPTPDSADHLVAFADEADLPLDDVQAWWQEICAARLSRQPVPDLLRREVRALRPGQHARVRNDARAWGERLAAAAAGAEVSLRLDTPVRGPFVVHVQLEGTDAQRSAGRRAVAQTCRAAGIPLARRRGHQDSPFVLEGDAGAQIAGLLDAAECNGVVVLLPATLARPARVETRLVVSGAATGFTEPTLTVEARCSLEGSELEAAHLLAARRPGDTLVQWRGSWYRLSADELEVIEHARALTCATHSPAQLLSSPALEHAVLEASGVHGPAAFLLRKEQAPAPPAPVLATPLLRWQAEALAWLCGLEAAGVGGVLADDMGLGKTLTLLALMSTRPGPSLVICPANVVPVWLEQAARHAPALSAVAVEHAAEVSERRGDLVVVSSAHLPRLAAALRERHFTRVILDEAHRVGRPRSAMARAVRSLPAEHCHVLTGTPGRVRSLARLLAFTCPDLVTGLEDRFPGLATRGPRGDASRRRFRRAAGPLVLRRTKQRPSRAPELERVACELGEAEAASYLAEVERTLRLARSRTGLARRSALLGAVTRLNRACVGTGTGTGSTKLARLVELVGDGIGAGDGVVVFALSPASARTARDALAAHGREAVLVVDGTRAARAALGRFESGDGPGVLVATLAAAGVGTNLVRASRVVHLEHGADPMLLQQANDRVRRIGQRRPVRIQHLVATGTLDERLERWCAEPGVDASAIATRLCAAEGRALAQLIGLER